MKTALLVAYYYPPLGGIGSQRALKWARYLSDFGWRAVVLTPAHGAYYFDPTLDEGAQYGIEVVRTPIWNLRPNSSANGAPAASNTPTIADVSIKAKVRHHVRTLVHNWLYVPDGQNNWYFPGTRAGRAWLREHRVDAIVSTSFPVTAHFIASRLARGAGVPWVADFRDLWTENQGLDFYSSALRKRLDQSLEQRILRRADALTTVSQAMAATLRQLAPANKTVEVIRNGYDAADFEGLQRVAPAQWTLTFVGTYYTFYDPSPLFGVLARLIAAGQIPRERVRLQFVGESHPVLQKLLQQSGLEKFAEFTGFVPHRAALQHQIDASVLVLLVPTDRAQTGIIPGKTFEYLGARRPILTLSPPEFEAAQIVEESGAGAVVNPHDQSAIESYLLSSYRTFCAGEDANITPRNLDSYGRRAGTQQLARLLDALS